MSNDIQNMMGAGTGAFQAKAINGRVSGNLTATGTTAADALALSSNYNVVTVTASGTGVILPSSAQPGDEFDVYNFGANSLSVYPPTGGNIMGSAGSTVGAAKGSKFVMLSAGVWGGLVSA